jgi:hypothetical protein
MRTREYRARMSRFRTPLGTSESSLTATRRRRPRRRCQQRRRARDWCADRRHRLNSMGSVTVKTMARFGRASWSGVVRARLVGRAEHSTMAAAVRRVPASIVCGVELAKPRLPVWPYENGTGASPCARPFSVARRPTTGSVEDATYRETIERCQLSKRRMFVRCGVAFA